MPDCIPQLEEKDDIFHKLSSITALNIESSTAPIKTNMSPHYGKLPTISFSSMTKKVLNVYVQVHQP